jgi:SpoVK/Ycf46/Vps4 family AAA+-type ATPase
MKVQRDIRVYGFPESASAASIAVCRSRLLKAVGELLDETGIEEVRLRIGSLAWLQSEVRGESRHRQGTAGNAADHDDMPKEVRAQRYKAAPPLYDFDQLVVPTSVKEELIAAVELVRAEAKVFDEWGLRKIEPYPRTALNLYGPPGTGKTLAAHALANYLGRQILPASYSQIESKFHGDGPKNVDALFHAAEREEALLFIDEAESLLSKRLVEVTQGSEQAINSMRSQLLVCLERFRGVVVFASNLVASYDKAFATRVRSIYFPLPDETCRREIWKRHLVPQLPVEPGTSIDRLAKSEDVCGRDIKNAVIDAAVRAALANRATIAEDDLLESVERIRRARIQDHVPKGRPATAQEAAATEAELRRRLTANPTAQQQGTV